MGRKLKILIIISVLFVSYIFASDWMVEKIIQCADGEIVGILVTKGDLSISSTIKSVTWTALNGESITIKWDGEEVVLRR